MRARLVIYKIVDEMISILIFLGETTQPPRCYYYHKHKMSVSVYISQS